MHIVIDRELHDLVRHVIHQLCRGRNVEQDIQQEVLLHLWRSNRQASRSWYVQACRYQAKHLLDKGRSVDSPKRHSGRVAIEDWIEEVNSARTSLEKSRGYGIYEEIFANDNRKEIENQLNPRERAVLDGLADGLSARGVARALGISHAAVNADRRKIASVAMNLGVTPAR